MSVLIRGMEMPNGCIVCPFKDIGMHTMTQCMLVAGWVKYADDGNGIPDACPLVEVPTPHGQLIDADKLFQMMENTGWHNKADRDEVAEELLLNAPTVIEAEGET